MKRRWIAICAAGMLVLGMTGCGGNASSGEGASSDGASSADTQSKSEKDAETGYTLDTVLYDQEGLKITASEYQINEKGTHSIVFEVENGTDSAIGFDYTSLDVNGFVVEDYSNPFSSVMDFTWQLDMVRTTSEEAGYDFEEELEDWYHIVPAGETAEKTVDVYLDDAEEACIGEIQQIDLSVAAMKFTDMEDLSTLGAQEMPEGETVSIQTDAFDGELVLPEVEGTEIYNQDGIRIVVLGMEFDEEYKDLEIGLYLENNTDKNIGLIEKDFSVNDFMTNAYLSMCSSVKSHAKACGNLSLIDELDLESQDEIQNLEFTVEIMDEDTYDTIGTATYTYEP